MTRAEVSIGASNLFLGAAVGAGVDQALFVMPGWFASPPGSLSLARGRGPAKLFVPLQVGALGGLVSAFALNRRDRTRRRLLAGALGLYVATWATTAAYFAPEIIRLTREDSGIPPDEVRRRGRRWLALSWGRHAALAAAWVLAAAAAVQPARSRALRPGGW